MDSIVSAEYVSSIITKLDNDDAVLQQELNDLSPYQLANVFESLTNEQRLKLWPNLDPEITGSVLAEMREDARNQFVTTLSEPEVIEAINSSESVDVIGIIDVLPKRKAQNLVNKLSPLLQDQLETSMAYSDDQVGRYADPNVYTVNSSATASEVIDELKQNEDVTELGNFWVVDDKMQLVGELTVSELLNAQEAEVISRLCHGIETKIEDNLGLLDASNLIRASSKTNLPVVTESGKFIGTFSLHDALVIFQEHYEAQVSHLGKVSDEDLFAPVVKSSSRRAIWLGINLVTAFLASFVIGLFDKVLVEVVALAVLMPIVASMGGITGSQTLTLTIRGLATGQLVSGNYKTLRNKEVAVALINGLVWALVVASISWYWFDNSLLSVILAMSIVVNMLIASLSGIFIPLLLDKLGIDPALAGSVILTTVTDIVGFFVFLGGASVLFLS